MNSKQPPKTDAEWQKLLTPEQYHVMCEGGTEPAFAGKFLRNKETGVYVCATCGAELFSSDTKFDSATGWPSFFETASASAVKLKKDISHGVSRTEVTCANCGGHLGHLFADGPKPTGKRYCINSLALGFKKS